MKPATINFINGTVLIVLSMWAYLSSTSPSFTALIPVFFGLVFWVLTPSFRKGNKVVAHLVVVLTLVLLVALIKPLTAAVDRQDALSIARVAAMMFTSLLAMIIYVRSFVLARRKG